MECKVKMSKMQAYSWLIQPGVQATLYGYDKHTNKALKVALSALKRDIEAKVTNKKNIQLDGQINILDYLKDNAGEV